MVDTMDTMEYGDSMIDMVIVWIRI